MVSCPLSQLLQQQRWYKACFWGGGLSGTPSDQEMHGHAGTVSLSQPCSDQGSSPLAAAAG